MAKTTYRVDGASSGEPSPGSTLSGRDSFGEPFAGPSADRTLSAPKNKRRKLFWVLVGIAILAVAMIVAIAALGASESPAVGTAFDPATASTAAYAAAASTEPVGPSIPLAVAAGEPGSTSSSASTATTAFTHAIADPVRLVIPALKVDAKIVAVGLTNGSDMEIPTVGLVGWYKLGPAPGATGPSVLVSHVSWAGKKGAFYKLKDLKPGDLVQDGPSRHTSHHVRWRIRLQDWSLPFQRHRVRAPVQVVPVPLSKKNLRIFFS